MSRYARGTRAKGQCARSGRVMALRDMVEDGYYEGLMVDPAWRDGEHPQESLPAVFDPVALYRPAPERDRIAHTVRFPLFELSTLKKGAELFEALENVHDLAADSFKVALYSDEPGDDYTGVDEMVAGGYTAGGIDWTFTLDGDVLVVDDSVWDNAEGPAHGSRAGNPWGARWALIYNAGDNSGLLKVNFGSLQTADNGEFRIRWSDVALTADATKITKVSF